jgi:hypothetical protein
MTLNVCITVRNHLGTHFTERTRTDSGSLHSDIQVVLINYLKLLLYIVINIIIAGMPIYKRSA